MSISGSQETKTALLQAHPAAGNTETAELDAQEDREIVGVNVRGNPSPAAAPDIGRLAAELRVGTDPGNVTSGETSQQDNLSWQHRADFTMMDDDTNNKAVSGSQPSSVWYGHGSGIEWNEDATLTLEAVATGGSGNCEASVYYREL